ncbi:MAG: chromosome partitioning protein [Bradyrhizobiaceae bacterium PARB1]|nr:MAG: chromosome partitioning protein [Bradyrhizobiaceae bacterium PARB1]
MPRLLLVAQETGGVGKSTLTRGVAEAVPDAPILELESSPRILEYDHGKTKGVKRVSHFPVRADRASIDRTGGQAARAEFDAPINAMVAAELPTIIDVGANTASSLLASFDDEFVASIADTGLEMALVVVVTANASALTDGAKLLASSKRWAKARFVVENKLRGDVDQAMLKRVADGAGVTVLPKFEFEPRTLAFLQATGLYAIPQLKTADFQKEYGFNQARRMVNDLKGFRLSVMEAVRPAATWLAS